MREVKTFMDEQEKKILWLPCPKCGTKTHIKLYEDTVLLNFPLCCPECGKETMLGVIKFKIVVTGE